MTDLSARLRDVLRPMTQEYVWAISTHECGGKDPGVCRNCDRNAEALSLNIEKAVAPFLSSLLEEREREIREALKVIQKAVRDDEHGEFWTARRWLDKQGVFNGDLTGLRVVEAVAKTALSRLASSSSPQEQK